METKLIETPEVRIVEFSDFCTVGELKRILGYFPEEMSFGFRNQAFQNLRYIVYKKNNSKSVCFEQGDATDCINERKVNLE